MIAIVPATQALVERFYGGPPPHTARAVVVLDGDEPIGICGLYTGSDRFVFFGEVTDEVRAKPKAMVRAARAVLEQARGLKAPVHSLADPKVKNAARFLERLGFERVQGDVFRLKGDA